MPRRLRCLLLALGPAFLAPGCAAGELTELLVVVDSDLPVPDGLDAVRVEVGGAMRTTASGPLTGAGATPLPRTVGLVHRGGPLGPVEVVAVGTRNGTEVVRARAITSFVRGRTLILPMFLSRRCVATSCGAEQTCSDGVCVSAMLDPATLSEWRGDVPRLDGGACTPFDERCNERDDDCDGRVDEDFDLMTDPTHCGSCARACAAPHAMPSCRAGSCAIAACEPGFGDCDGEATNGCEEDLTASAAHCGGCGRACALANASTSCVAGACAIAACEPGFGDCDGEATNGCETSLTTTTDCGACGRSCSVVGGTARCAAGTCVVGSCEPGFGDCDGEATNGCETSLTTTTDCGACAMPCDLPNATETCASGSCAIVACEPGFDDCDASPANGCEASLRTLADCGACGTACTIANGTGTCATGTCRIASCNVGFGDCDLDPANGCETDLRRNDMHCGSCGNACPPGQSCRMGGVCR